MVVSRISGVACTIGSLPRKRLMARPR